MLYHFKNIENKKNLTNKACILMNITVKSSTVHILHSVIHIVNGNGTASFRDGCDAICLILGHWCDWINRLPMTHVMTTANRK